MYHFINEDTTIYEGHTNRLIAADLITHLTMLNIDYQIVYEDWADTPLRTRVVRANEIAKQYEKTVFVSLHSNAFGNSAKGASQKPNGWEIYIAPKSKKGLELAKEIDTTSRAELERSMRWRDNGPYKGTAIKEARFTVLMRTSMPAVLIENGFFTNWEDAKKLLDAQYRWRSAKSTAAAIQNYFKKYE